MIKKLGVAMALFSMTLGMQAQKLPDYKNSHLSAETRTKDLLSRMTLEEKVGQLECLLGWQTYTIDARRKDVKESELYRKMIDERHIGMLWGTYRADPWTQKTLANGLTPSLAAKAGNALQKYAIEHTRLGIPVFLAEEAPHGHMAIGTTVFPTGIGMAATWSTDLIHEVGAVIGKEIRLQGGHISYGPVLDLAREPRWSRVEETYGEDPVLTGTIGAAMVGGLGGGNLSLPYSTIATLKHFIAYGTTEGGQNGGPALIGQHELHEAFLPPFHQVIKAGALSVMTSYNSIDGIPSTSNAYLFRQLLRGQWGFRGFVVSDLYSIDGLTGCHVADDSEDAGMMALRAGVDVDLGGNCYAQLIDAVQKGKVSEALVDTAASHVLRLKFEMGLFDHPYANAKLAATEVRSAAHKDVALRVAQASITLLKNNANTLPLQKNMHVAVIGPNADNVYNMLGDYTAPQEDGNVKTVRMGIQQKIGEANVTYVKGCAIRDTTQDDIEQAVAAAREADVVVAVVGGSSARDFKTSYKATGAAETNDKALSDMESGEGFDRATLTLLGHQGRLLAELKKTGKPLVVVYIEGRPLDKNWAAEQADALLTAYYPGQEGGTAIADVLFGDYNPAGRLPFSVPRNVGQLPVYYNRKAPAPHNYVESPATPLYPFGYGLSYTTFNYGPMTVTPTGTHRYEVALNVTNAGSRDGDEVVQLYLRHLHASVVTPLKQLIRFQRIHLKSGETRQVKFLLEPDDISVVNAENTLTVEPGKIALQAGSSSDDIRQKAEITVTP
jgi:beta-glucosidase